jgi:hypothetical protein
MIGYSRKGIESARVARKESRDALDKAVEGSMTQVFNSLQSLGQAQLHYLSAVREYDKAQVRLLLLLGGSSHPVEAPAPCVTPEDVGRGK